MCPMNPQEDSKSRKDDDPFSGTSSGFLGIFVYGDSRLGEVWIMPAIASLEDLKAAQRDLLEAKDLKELKAAFKKWRRIGWKNICKLWLGERTPEQLKGEGV